MRRRASLLSSAIRIFLGMMLRLTASIKDLALTRNPRSPSTVRLANGSSRPIILTSASTGRPLAAVWTSVVAPPTSTTIVSPIPGSVSVPKAKRSVILSTAIGVGITRLPT